jgi:predicted Zn-dependent peptidase
MIEDEARAIAEGGMSEKEFAMAREQLKPGYILGLESTSARMQSTGRRLLLMNTTRTESETIERINAVSLDAANALMKQMLTAPHSVALVGKGVEDIRNRIPVQRG